MTQEKIALYSIIDLKNSSDDALPTYLTSIKFRQSHTLCNVRLVLGYVAILISAATFLWDFKYGFETTKLYTAISVVMYTIINGVLTYWVTFVEKGIIYAGAGPKGDKIEISSKVEKYSPIYNLTITTQSKNQNQKPEKIILRKHFNTWFNKAGYFVPLPFQQMLASNVPIIGDTDPTKVVKVASNKNPVSDTTDEKSKLIMEEKWASLLAESTGVEVDQRSNVKTSRVGRK